MVNPGHESTKVGSFGDGLYIFILFYTSHNGDFGGWLMALGLPHYYQYGGQGGQRWTKCIILFSGHHYFGK